jgi:hypothetical protein
MLVRVHVTPDLNAVTVKTTLFTIFSEPPVRSSPGAVFNRNSQNHRLLGSRKAAGILDSERLFGRVQAVIPGVLSCE